VKIFVIGSGVVGKATGKGLAEKGHQVIFVDINHENISSLVAEGYDARNPSQLEQEKADIAMFCVSTPSRLNGEVDLDYIQDAMTQHAAWLSRQQNYHLVVVRSTVLPGTTRGMFLPILESSGKKVGKDFGLCMNPEFLRAISALEDFRHPWMTVIGEYDKRSGDILEQLYQDFGGKIWRVSIETAEMEKYAHNLFNAAKISFTNEIYKVCQQLGLDGNEIMEMVSQSAEGMWNLSYGTKGGYPFDGACLPKDASGFLAFAKFKGIDMPLLEAVIKINKQLELEARRSKSCSQAATTMGHDS
jgi:UDPglucose 6-dehydrogenase